MKVIAAINGTITAESMAFYALKFAQIQQLPLVLLHIENSKDAIEDVQASIKRIQTIAVSESVETESIILKGDLQKVLKEYLDSVFADVIFCSTRKKKRFISHSFSEALTKMDLNVDIAIVRIVNIGKIVDLNHILLSIQKDKLSVKKFTFFSTLASAYQADGEIYSVSNLTKNELAHVDIHQVRDKLGSINYNLRHYIKLSHYMPFSLHIKHDFTTNEAQSILSHIAKSDCQLVIIGAKRLSVTSLFKREMPIEELMREASVNTIAYYPKED